MDNMVKTFVNEEFGSVRTIEENGKVLFFGSDIAKAKREVFIDEIIPRGI